MATNISVVFFVADVVVVVVVVDFVAVKTHNAVCFTIWISIFSPFPANQMDKRSKKEESCTKLEKP